MFLISFVISDIFIFGFNIFFGLLYNFNGEWMYGEIFCKFVFFVMSVNVIVSIMILMVVVLERYSINIFYGYFFKLGKILYKIYFILVKYVL